MSSKTKNVEKSKMEHGRKRKRAAAGDMSETIGDSKKPKLAAYPGSSEDECDKLVVRIQHRPVPELSHTGARDTDPPMEAESLTLRESDIDSVHKRSHKSKTGSKMKNTRKKKRTTPSDPNAFETMGDSKKSKLSANEGPREDICNENEESEPYTVTAYEESIHPEPNMVDKTERRTLHEWCKFKGDRIDAMKALIKGGAKVNHQDTNRYTPLHYLSELEDGGVEEAQLLLHKGALTYRRNKNEQTALHLVAATHTNLKLLKMLLHHCDKQINDHDVDGRTPLHLLCLSPDANLKMISEIINAGADINAKDKDGRTPLHLLCLSPDSNLKMISEIINAGANINAKDKDGRTPLHLLCLLPDSNLKMISEIINAGANINATDKDGCTPLHCSSGNDCIRVVNKLIYFNANLDQKDEEGQTALHLSCCPEVIATLIISGAKPDLQDKHGWTPLYYKSVDKDADLVRTMLSLQADPNVKDETGCTALKFCSEKGATEVLNIMLSFGANPDIQDNNGRTALHEACSAEVTSTLLSYHADPNISDADGLTALHLSHDQKVIGTLLNAGASPNLQDLYAWTPLHHRSAEGNSDAVKILLSHGADPNISDEEGQTALHQACNADTVAALTDGGADVNCSDKHGCTALHLTSSRFSDSECTCNKISLLKAILQAGGDPNIPNDEGQTALHLSQIRSIRLTSDAHDQSCIQMTSKITSLSEEQEIEIVKELLSAGADINAQDLYGRTVLYFVCNAKVLREIVSSGKKMELEVKDNDGNTPLLHWVKRGKLEIIQELIHAGADANAKDKFEQNGLFLTSKHEIAEALICGDVANGRPGADINAHDSYGRTPLHLTTNAAIAKLLLSKGALIRKCVLGRTPIHTTTTIEVIRVILSSSNGALNNMQDEQGNTCLHSASERGDALCLKELLVHFHSGINMKNRTGDTALHLATYGGHHDCCEELLRQNGIDVNIQNQNEDTPLHMASKRKGKDCLNILLGEQDITRNIKNGDGNSASQPTMNSPHGNNGKSDTDISIQNSTGDTPLCSATRNNVFDCVKNLLSIKTINVNMKNKCGDTALHIAAKRRYSKCCTELVSHSGIDISVPNSKGDTPLHAATCSVADDVNCLKTLLEVPNVNINDQNYSGDTALHLAIRNKHANQCKELLSQQHINVNVQNDDGDTPLHTAVMVEDTECLKALLWMKNIDINIKNKKGLEALPYPAFPVNASHKVAVCGESGGFLTKAICALSNARPYPKKIMAGIRPYHLKNHMLLYNLSGLSSNHCAYLVATCAKFPAAFLITLDITKDSKSIKKELHYWSAMIDTVCHKDFIAPVIIMGIYSENDQFEDCKLKEMCETLQQIAKVTTKHHLVTVKFLNRTSIQSHDIEQLFLELSHEAKSMPGVSILCQILYTILMNIPDDIITLPDLIVRLEKEKNVIASALIADIEPLLIDLTGKGLVLYIPGSSQLHHDSWIIRNVEEFLKKICSNLLEAAKKHHHNLAKNLGMVDRNTLQQIFPEHNIELIAYFLMLMGICQPVGMSKMDTAIIPLSKDIPLFFFPDFVSYYKPTIDVSPSNFFSWSMDVNQFYPFQIFVDLLFQLACKFTLPTSCHQSGHIKYMCDVWSKGIKWNSKKQVMIMVEMNDNFKSLSLVVSSFSRSSEYHALYHSVQNVIKETFKLHCPDKSTDEFVTCPSSVSLDKEEHRVSVKMIQFGLINNKERINASDDQSILNLKQWKNIQPQLKDLIGVDGDGHSSADVSGILTTVNSPTVEELMYEIGTKIGSKWKELGKTMGLQAPTLERIWEKHWTKGTNSRYTDAAEDMFMTWLKDGPGPFTWMRISECLLHIREDELSKTLDMKYNC
eukprot:Em0007g578a